MTDPVFRVEPGVLAAALVGAPVVLGGSEGRHAADVRRLRPGERVVVTDGEGAAARCTVTGVRKGELELVVQERWAEPEAYPRIVVVQALAKGERGETAVETLTEVGVDAIVPWAASRSVTRWAPERADRALERWRSAAAEAAKQARRIRWPDVRPPASTSEVADILRGAELALVLHEDATAALAAVEVPEADGSEVVLVVGPEGGISGDELAAFAAARARAVRLGPTVLRTSTAGTAAAAALLARTARWA